MSFREKSAWAMAAVMGVAGLFYLNMVVSAWSEAGGAPDPRPIMGSYVVLVVIASIVLQIALAVTYSKEAEQPADERERPIIAAAGNWSGQLLAAGAVSALLLFLWQGDGNLLFHLVMGSLILSSIAEYALQIRLMRRGY
jgi:hypothetical protein